MNSIGNIALWALLPCGIIAAIWIAFWNWHTHNMRNHYNKIAMNVDRPKNTGERDKESRKERLLKLFFYRQTTYEFSAYAILIICLIFLIGCVYLFFRAPEFVRAPQGEKFTTEQFLIALTSLRLGIALIVFFICQVLLRLYRFCLKFSAFYTGLFDAFFIHEEMGKTPEEVIPLFTVKDLVDENPPSPSIDLVQTIKGGK